MVIELIGEAATKLARSNVPPEIVSGITALQKPDGGMRSSVVGDVFRRLVAGMSAHSSAPKSGRYTPIPIRLLHKSRYEVCGPHGENAHQFERPCHPLCGCVGTYDSISRNAMCQGVADMVRSYCSFASSTRVLQRFCGRMRWEKSERCRVKGVSTEKPGIKIHQCKTK